MQRKKEKKLPKDWRTKCAGTWS